jgi:HAD superfamily phosphatase
VKPKIEIVIFDMDGVLVDVRDTFHSTILLTVKHFTGKSVPRVAIQDWKNRGGYNDDWKLSHHWIRSLGGRVPYEEVKRQFQVFYWGEDNDGTFLRERWLLPLANLRRLEKKVELAIFTGRTRRELKPTLERFRVGRYFRRIVTQNDVTRLKPHPEGLLHILDGRDPAAVIYVGDNVDDAKAAKRAGILFAGVLPPRGLARRLCAARLKEHGAKVILRNVGAVEELLA